MKRNIGLVDRILRLAFALAVLGLWLGGVIGGTLALLLGILGLVLAATAFVGTCPLYLPFGISTRRKA